MRKEIACSLSARARKRCGWLMKMDAIDGMNYVADFLLPLIIWSSYFFHLGLHGPLAADRGSHRSILWPRYRDWTRYLGLLFKLLDHVQTCWLIFCIQWELFSGFKAFGLKFRWPSVILFLSLSDNLDLVLLQLKFQICQHN